MQKMLILAMASLVSIAGCAESPSEPAVVDAPSFGLAENSGGASIARYDRIYFLIAYDAEKQLLVAHSAGNGLPSCGIPITEAQLGSVQDVISPEDALLVNTLMQADPAFIWVWSTPVANFAAVRCTPPLGKGVGRLVSTDNDFYADVVDHTRVNSFGYTAQGTLVGSEGQAIQYSGVFRTVWQSGGLGEIRNIARITLSY